MIPKKFHFIWLGAKPIPSEFAAYIAGWISLHPDWQAFLWHDQHEPQLRSQPGLFPVNIAGLGRLQNQTAFDRFRSFAARADILRLEILYRNGGVYLDTDMEPRKNIEPLLAGVECFAGWEYDGGVINNAIFGAAKYHGSVAAAIDNLPLYLTTRNEIDLQDAAHATGPFFLTRVWYHDARVKKFPRTVFYPYDWNEPWRAHLPFPDAYAIHRWRATWIGEVVEHKQAWGNEGIPACLVVSVGSSTKLRESLHLRSIEHQSVRNIAHASLILDNRSGGVEGRDMQTYHAAGDCGAAIVDIVRTAAALGIGRILFVPADHVLERKTVLHHCALPCDVGLGLHKLYSSAKIFDPDHPEVFPFTIFEMHAISVRMPRAPMSGTPADLEEVFSINTFEAARVLRGAAIHSLTWRPAAEELIGLICGTGGHASPIWTSHTVKLMTVPIGEKPVDSGVTECYQKKHAHQPTFYYSNKGCSS